MTFFFFTTITHTKIIQYLFQAKHWGFFFLTFSDSKDVVFLFDYLLTNSGDTPYTCDVQGHGGPKCTNGCCFCLTNTIESKSKVICKFAWRSDAHHAEHSKKYLDIKSGRIDKPKGQSIQQAVFACNYGPILTSDYQRQMLMLLHLC